MDFLILNLCLCVICVPVFIVHRLGQKLLMLSVASFFILALPEREREDRSAFVAVGRIAICACLFLYIAVGWAAFCVAIASNVSNRPTATWHWLYVAASLVWFIQLPLRVIDPSRLYCKVSTETRTVWDQTGYTFHTTLIASLIILGLSSLAWVVFTIWPNLTMIPYGWILKPILWALEAIDGFLKRNWWLPAAILALALVRMLVVRTRKNPSDWRSWGTDLDAVVMMAKTLSSEWAGYRKTEFHDAILTSWGGTIAEDCGSYILVRNERYSHFEFHFMFGDQPNADMAFLYVRGLKELQGLWILGRSGELALSLKPVNGSTVSAEAKKAAGLLQQKFDLQFAD